MDISRVGSQAEWAFQVLEVKQIGYSKYRRSSSLGITCIGCLAVWAFNVLRGKEDWVFQDIRTSSLGIFYILEVKQIGYFKYLRSSSLGISCIGGNADWTIQVLDV